MTSQQTQLSAQLSAIGKSQWEAQLDILQTWSSRALDSANQLIALNLRASRTSVEQATGTFKQLLDATNPRDVIAVGSRAQGQWHYLFEYGRELLGIASGAPIQAWSTQPPARVLPTPPLQLARSANVPTSVSQVLDQVSIATADATTVTTEIAAAAADTGAALAEAGLHAARQATDAVQKAQQPVADAAIKTAEKAADVVDQGVAKAYEASTQAAETQQAAKAGQQAEQKFEAAVEAAIADDVPPAKATPLAQALNEVAPKPASAEHPIASTIALDAHEHIDLPHVTPLDAEPPVPVPPPPPAAKERRTRGRK